MKTISLGIVCLIISTSGMAQNVGIGTSTPKVKLHVSAGNTALTPYSLTNFLIESTDRTYLQFLTPANKEAGVMFGNPTGTTQGGVYYNNPGNPEGLDFRTNGNIVRMEIDNAGNVEMKGGLSIKGNLPAAGATLVSKDLNGTTNWQRASAFKVEGLLDEADVYLPNVTTYKILFNNLPVYNLGLTYAAGLSEYTVPVKGIYFFDVQVKSVESQNASSAGRLTLELKRKRNGVTTTLKTVDDDSGNFSADLNPVRCNKLTGDFLLEPNDIIWLQCVTSLNHTIYGSKEVTSFSGRLVTQLY
jgi:hypothetical protein